jgi:hypothetical protein
LLKNEEQCLKKRQLEANLQKKSGVRKQKTTDNKECCRSDYASRALIQGWQIQKNLRDSIVQTLTGT